ncbi:MAG TPA: AI-2E family transporter [Gemmatimonadaceae bacterium]|nr:AI-2E family transporter [Gemmatimonadaceae bacterium]
MDTTDPAREPTPTPPPPEARAPLSLIAVAVPSLTVLAVLASLYTLYFARAFLLPIAFALLFNFLLSPAVRALARLHVRPPIGAGILVLATVGGITLGAVSLARPVQDWVTRAPATFTTAQERLRTLMRPIERVKATAEQVERVATGGARRSPEVVVRGPTLTSRIFGTTQRLIAALLQMVILLYFLLASGDLFLQKVIKLLPNVREKQTAVRIARETEQSISTYLLTALMVNIAEGVLLTLVLSLLGMPNPALWGVLTVVLEFIPYIGATIMTVVLGIAAITSYDSVGQALLVPASFVVINLIQGNLVSPLLLGNRLSLNPVALFVGLAFWFWIWGIAGAFVAVPLMAVFKIVCDHVESLRPIGEFLGQRDERERRAIVR